MARKRRSGLASYEDVDPGYLEERRLRPTAGWVLLWALGVGAVISGDFYGWHFGLAAGGFGGLAIATLVMAAMYVCMVYSIAELSAASYIVLRVRRPDLPRPYRSPLGIPGAAVGALLSLLALGATCADGDLIRGVVGVVVFLVLVLVYYFAWSRRRLVAQAPQEEAALAVRRKPPESGRRSRYNPES